MTMKLRNVMVILKMPNLNITTKKIYLPLQLKNFVYNTPKEAQKKQ